MARRRAVEDRHRGSHPGQSPSICRPDVPTSRPETSGRVGRHSRTHWGREFFGHFGRAHRMNESLLIPIFAGVAVLTLIGGVGLVMSRSNGSLAEERLDGLTGKAKAKA